VQVASWSLASDPPTTMQQLQTGCEKVVQRLAPLLPAPPLHGDSGNELAAEIAKIDHETIGLEFDPPADLDGTGHVDFSMQDVHDVMSQNLDTMASFYMYVLAPFLGWFCSLRMLSTPNRCGQLHGYLGMMSVCVAEHSASQTSPCELYAVCRAWEAKKVHQLVNVDALQSAVTQLQELSDARQDLAKQIAACIAGCIYMLPCCDPGWNIHDKRIIQLAMDQGAATLGFTGRLVRKIAQGHVKMLKGAKHIPYQPGKKTYYITQELLRAMVRAHRAHLSSHGTHPCT
jgi:hypothetical protein